MSSNSSATMKRKKSKTISQEGTSSVRDLLIPFKKRLVLEVIEGEDIGKLYNILSVRWVIGRVDSDLDISDPKVSKKHAVIEAFSQSHITIRDLASTNGTCVNGTQINQRKLTSGDIISVGLTKLKFLILDPID